MMRRIWAQTRLDWALLRRLRFLGLAPALGLVAALLLRGFVPAEARPAALPLALFALQSALGPFLAAGAVWLEQAEGALAALRLTPLRPLEYLWAKGLSQMGLHLLFALPAAVGLGFGPGWGALLLGLVSHGWFLTFMGLHLALSRPQLARFFLPAMLLLGLLQVPLLAALGQWPAAFWQVWPGAGALGAMLGAAPGLGLVGALVWPVLALALAARSLGRLPCWGRA